MATRAISAYRVAEAKIPVGISAVASVPRMSAKTLDAKIHDGGGAARGIVFGLLLSSTFWVGVYAMLF
jgi:hypothetical protein